VVICLECDADLHTAQLMPLPLTVSCFKIQSGYTFLVPAHPGSPGKRAVTDVCVFCLDFVSVINRQTYWATLYVWHSRIRDEAYEARVLLPPQHYGPARYLPQNFGRHTLLELRPQLMYSY